LRRLNDDLWPVPPSTNVENNTSIPPKKRASALNTTIHLKNRKSPLTTDITEFL